MRPLATAGAGGLVFALLLTGGCHKLFGDYSVSENGITGVCAPGTMQCYGNALQRCNAMGSAWENHDTCASDALCDQTQGMCKTPACSAGERRCNGTELQGCNSARDGWLRLATCATPGHCSAASGVCTEQPCEPGKTQCNGPVFQACKDDRSGWTDLEPCAASSLCNPVEGCAEGACSAGRVRCEGAELQICNATLDGWAALQSCDSAALCDANAKTCREVGCTTPGAYRCDDAGTLERCAEDLTGWVHDAVCESAAHCDALNGTCNASPCKPGDHQCNGAVLQVCNAESTGFDSLATCLSDGLCQQTLTNAESTCRGPSCAGGTFQCAGAQPQICNAALTGYRDNGTPCMTAELCNSASGTCGAPVCAPGQTRCTGAQPEICNSGRTMFVPHGDACASETLCRPDTGTCGDVACLAGQKRCDPTDQGALQICNQTLDGWDACDTCATPELCSASLNVLACGADACTEPTCSAADRWCGGADNRTLYRCPPSRINSQPITIDTCDTKELCDATRSEAMRTTCIEKSCNLEDRWCGGTGNRSLFKCPPSLINSQATALDVCETNGLCEQAHASLNATMCPEPACAASGYSCGGAGSRVLQFCNVDRTALTTCDTCDSAALCTASLGATACSANSCHVCLPGEKNCTGSQLRVCNAARTGFDAKTCGSAALCMNSLMPATQTNCDECVAGTFNCDGAQPQRCNAPATGPAVWADLGEPCENAAACDASTGECSSMMGNAGSSG